MSQAFHGDIPSRSVPAIQGAYRAQDRRDPDPLNQLGRRLNDICVRAVDPLQIAAALESEGFTDASARHQFGVNSVFDLAQLLFDRIPLRASNRAAVRVGRESPLRDVSHGLLFALPAFFYPALVSHVGTSLAALAITIAVIVGWGWSQLIVRVSYLMRGTGSNRSAAAWLRSSAVAGIVFVGGISAAIAASAGLETMLVIIAVAQMAYHMAAAILIHYRREELLLLCVAPGLLAGLVFLAAPGALPPMVVHGLIGLALVAALATALLVGPGSPRGEKRRHATGRELHSAAPFLLYGLVCALLVSYDSLRFSDWIGTTAIGLTLAPLVLSMGVMEWQLRTFRERVAIAIAGSTNTRQLGRTVWTLFVAALARYALVLAALSLASLFLILRLDQNGAYLTTTLLANWVLGCAFFIGFGLISQNRIGMVTKFAAVALVVHLLNLTTNVGFLAQGATEASSYLLACLVFTFFLLSVARSALCEIRNYSYDLHLSRSTHVLQGGGVQG